MSLHATTSQTVGPYLHIGMTWLIIEDLAPAGVAGERVAIEGSIVDGDGKPVDDAAVEIWQANPQGKYGDKGFRGFGRSATDAQGPVPLQDRQARTRARRRRQAAGAAHRGQYLHARPAQAAGDADLLPGRSGECRGPGARAGAGRRGAAR
jgi:protocatechuate 3,4-dioxygenase beta subunit